MEKQLPEKEEPIFGTEMKKYLTGKRGTNPKDRDKRCLTA
jgi:hypothetical protein